MNGYELTAHIVWALVTLLCVAIASGSYRDAVKTLSEARKVRGY